MFFKSYVPDFFNIWINFDFAHLLTVVSASSNLYFFISFYVLWVLTLSRSFFLRPGLKLNSYRDLHLILPVAWRSVWITQVVWNHISNALQEPVWIIKIQRKIFPFIQSWTSDRKNFPISPLCSNVFLA